MLPSRRKTHLYCNRSCGRLQAIPMEVQSAAQSQSAKSSKQSLAQRLHASCSHHALPSPPRHPHPPPPAKQHKLQHTAVKHPAASVFSVQRVGPALHTVIQDKGTKVLNLASSTACTEVPVGTLAKALFHHLWGAPCCWALTSWVSLGKLQEPSDPTRSGQGLRFRLRVPFS